MKPKMTANVNLLRSIYFHFHLQNVLNFSERLKFQKGQVQQRKQVVENKLFQILNWVQILSESSRDVYLEIVSYNFDD